MLPLLRFRTALAALWMLFVASTASGSSCPALEERYEFECARGSCTPQTRTVPVATDRRCGYVMQTSAIPPETAQYLAAIIAATEGQPKDGRYAVVFHFPITYYRDSDSVEDLRRRVLGANLWNISPAEAAERIEDRYGLEGWLQRPGWVERNVEGCAEMEERYLFDCRHGTCTAIDRTRTVISTKASDRFLESTPVPERTADYLRKLIAAAEAEPNGRYMLVFVLSYHPEDSGSFANFRHRLGPKLFPKEYGVRLEDRDPKEVVARLDAAGRDRWLRRDDRGTGASKGPALACAVR